MGILRMAAQLLCHSESVMFRELPTGTIDDSVKDEEVNALFGRISSRYDLFTRLTSLHMDRLWRRRAISCIPLKPGMRVLDVGAGTGELTFAVASRLGSEGEVIGIDPCDAMLREARRKLKKWVASYPLSRVSIRFVEGRAEELPFDSESFDAVITSFVMRNMIDMSRGLDEFFRVLAPGGSSMILEMSRPAPTLTGYLYRWYLRNVTPAIGRFCLGEHESSAYLESSILQFLAPEEICRELGERGLVRVRYHPLFLGIAGVYVGEKEPQERSGNSS